VSDTRWHARFTRNRSAVAGAALVAALVVFAWIGPLLAGHGPLESDFAHGVAADEMPVGPCPAFPLGADRIFRDVFARLAVAGRLSLLVAIAATLIATAIGAVVGIVAGYYEGTRFRVPWPAAVAVAGALLAIAMGWTTRALAFVAAGIAASFLVRFAGPRLDVDGLLMRAVDVMLAFPFLLLVMAIASALDHTSASTLFVVLGVTGWMGTARVLRARTLQVRSLEYVVASRALGQPAAWVMLKHVLPNVAAPLIVSGTVMAAQMLVADSVLSYLGLGVAPPTPTWGRMLFEGQDYYAAAPWLVAAPAAAIVLAVWGFHMLGEGLRDALDPHEA
jgi:ABC-type dipeptide/oligopeptide/nickel transport system permease subunit